MFKENTGRYEILTPTGFKPFIGIQRQHRNFTISIKTNRDVVLEGASNHRVLTQHGFQTLEQIEIGDIVYCGTEKQFINEKIINNKLEFVYEPIEVATHEYITNSLVSHNCEFIGSTNTLINPNKLLQLASVRPIRSDEHFAIYEDPSLPENKKKLYVIVVDTSRGVGGDYSAFAVFDVSSIPYRVVGRYKNNEISPLLFPNIIHQFAKVFNDAYVCVEVNDNGQQVADILYRELEYENMIFSQFKGRAGQSMSSGFGMKPAVGVRTTKLLKRVGCTNLKSLVESEKLIIEDNEIINELFQFVEVGESYQAEEGAHDDLVMCCVIFGWLVQQPYFKDWTDTNVRERLVRENLQLIDEDLLPMLSNEEEFINNNEIIEISDRAFQRFLIED